MAWSRAIGSISSTSPKRIRATARSSPTRSFGCIASKTTLTSAGAGWTVTAYASGTGVVWNNTNTLTQPAVAGTAQTLYSCGWCDTVGPTGGNINFFIDLGSSDGVGIGTNVVLTALTGAIFTTY